MRFSTVPFLLALVMAIAKTPTNVYQVCAWNVGTLEIEPWRRRAASVITPKMRAFTSRLRAWFQAAGGLPAVAAAVVLLAMLILPHPAHATVLCAGLVGLKDYQQRDADLKAQIAKGKKDRAAIGETALREKRAMTPEEKEKFLSAVAPIEALESQLTENADLLAAAVASNEAERNFQGTNPDPDAAAQQRANAAAGLQVGADELDKKSKAPGFFGRQLHAVRKAALILKGGDESLSTDERGMLKMMGAATGANTDVPSEGGFLVDSQRSATIIQRSYSVGEVLQRITPMPIGAGFNGTKLPAIDETSRADSSRYGGIVSGWLGQGNTLSAGKPKFREIDLKLRKVGAFVYSTDEMNVDAVVFEAWVNRFLPLELQFRTEDAVVNGAGSNQPLGLLSSPSVITITRSSASHILSDDLRAMVNRMWAPLWGRAVFFVDQSTLGEFDQLAIPIGTGGQLDPSYKPAGSVPGQKYATYKNIPIIPVEYCAALGTTGDIILVNLDEYLLIDKGGVDQAVSLHVAFLTDEAVYRFMYRVDGQIAWNAALTPKSGGSTLGCVIVLS